MTTTIRLSGGDLGRESMRVRCNLSEASAPVEVDYCEGEGWKPTQWQCANTCHRTAGLVEIAKQLAAQAVEMQHDVFDCDWEEIETATVYVIREINGSEYWSDERGWVPGASLASEYETRDEAAAIVTEHCQSRDVAIYAREAE